MKHIHLSYAQCSEYSKSRLKRGTADNKLRFFVRIHAIHFPTTTWNKIIIAESRSKFLGGEVGWGLYVKVVAYHLGIALGWVVHTTLSLQSCLSVA